MVNLEQLTIELSNLGIVEFCDYNNEEHNCFIIALNDFVYNLYNITQVTTIINNYLPELNVITNMGFSDGILKIELKNT